MLKSEPLWFWPYDQKNGPIINAISDPVEGMLWRVMARVNKGDVFIDVGAHDGLYSLYASKKIGNGLVYAFEASQFAFKAIKENIRNNGISNIILQHAIVSDSLSDAKKFYVDLIQSRTSSVYRDNMIGSKFREFAVATVTLDHYFLTQRKAEKINFINLDVEGSEFAVLQGAQRILNKFRPAMRIEFYGYAIERSGINLKTFIDFLGSFGYVPTLVEEQTGIETRTSWKKLLDLSAERPVKNVQLGMNFPHFANLILERE